MRRRADCRGRGRAGSIARSSLFVGIAIACERQHAHRMSMARLLDSPLIALPLRNANFGLYSAGSGISLVGMWMQRIAIGWLTWQLTESGFWLGVIAFAEFFPVILIGPFAGAAADRWDRLKVVKISQTISLLQATALFGSRRAVISTSGCRWRSPLFKASSLRSINRRALPWCRRSSPRRTSHRRWPSIRLCSTWLASSVRCSRVWHRVVGRVAAFAANAISYIPFLLALAHIRVAPAGLATPKRSFGADLRSRRSLHRDTSRHRGAAGAADRDWHRRTAAQ